MAPQVSNPPEQEQQHTSQLPATQEAHISRSGIISLLVAICLLLLLFTGLLVRNLPTGIKQSATNATNHLSPASGAQVADQDDLSPLSAPGSVNTPALRLPPTYYIVYELQNKVYVASTADGVPQLVATPGYVYNRATPPLLTPSGLLLYAGNGLWMTDIFDGSAKQIIPLPQGQVITSLVLSNDGTSFAWSTEPANGASDSNVAIYTSSLARPMQATMVYQHAISDCPCFRVFSFTHSSGKHASSVLFFTDDRGDHHAVAYGLWALNVSQSPLADPHLLLDADSQQGPLAISFSGGTLLYSSYEGFVPGPTDGSVPDDLDALNYANSLSLMSIDGSGTLLKNVQNLLPEQYNLNNSAAYHWVTTPLFSPDSKTLVYVEFSSDIQVPFDRHSALYIVHISGSGSYLRASKPQLLATSTSLFTELGPWLDNHLLTFYSDGAIYALDTRINAVAMIANTKTYARIVAAVGQDSV